MISKAESLIKSIVYRLFGTIATFAIAFAFTQQFLISSGIAIVEMISKTALYYLYERFWVRLRVYWKNKTNKVL